MIEVDRNVDWSSEVDYLREAVADAEVAREAYRTEEVGEIFDKVVGDNGRLALWQEVVGELDDEVLQTLAVGVIGMCRIVHVLCNQQLGNEGKRDEGMFARVEEIYDEVDLECLPSWTIHGDPIDWPSEVWQDYMRTYQLQGESEKMGEVFGKVNGRLSERQKNFTEQCREELSDEQVEELVDEMVAIESSWAVAKMRWAGESGNLVLVEQAMQHIHKAFDLGGQNKLRMRTLSKRALGEVFGAKKWGVEKGRGVRRFRHVEVGTRILWLAGRGLVRSFG